MSKGYGSTQLVIIKELTESNTPMDMNDLVSTTGLKQQSLHRAMNRLISEKVIKLHTDKKFKVKLDGTQYLKNVYTIK